jgi:hypothetical protein
MNLEDLRLKLEDMDLFMIDDHFMVHILDNFKNEFEAQMLLLDM